MKILIVGPSWVGDSVISQSLIKVILSKSKEAKIDVLSPEWTGNIFKRMDEVSETINLPFSHGEMKLKERADLGKTLRVKNYDQAIVLPNSLKSSLVPYFGEIPIRTGWRGEMRFFLINDMRILDKKISPRMIDRFVALAFKTKSEQAVQAVFPLFFFAYIQFKIADLALPKCKSPEGLGAKRVKIFLSLFILKLTYRNWFHFMKI